MSTSSEETCSDTRRRRIVSVRPSGRMLLLGTLVGFPASAVLLVLSLRSLHAGEIGHSLRNAHPGSLALAVCASSLVYVVQAARWRLLALATPPLPFNRFLDWAIGAVAVNNVVPGRPGDVLRIEWLSRGAAMPRTRALASVTVDRGLDLLVLVAAFAVTYPAVEHAGWLNRVGGSGVAIALLVLLVFAAAVVYARRAGAAPTGRLGRLVATLAHEARLRITGWRGVAAVLLSVLAWGTWALSAWLVASSLGIALTPVELVFVTAVINLGVAIPSSPGFIGTYQWLGVAALGVLGVSHTQGFAFSVLLHAAWFVPTTLAGAALVLRKLPALIAGLLADRSAQSDVA